MTLLYGAAILAMAAAIRMYRWIGRNCWDHWPTDEELGQRLIEEFVLPSSRD